MAETPKDLQIIIGQIEGGHCQESEFLKVPYMLESISSDFRAIESEAFQIPELCDVNQSGVGDCRIRKIKVPEVRESA